MNESQAFRWLLLFLLDSKKSNLEEVTLKDSPLINHKLKCEIYDYRKVAIKRVILG